MEQKFGISFNLHYLCHIMISRLQHIRQWLDSHYGASVGWAIALLTLWQLVVATFGVDLCDTGYYLTFFDNIFKARASVEYNFMYYLSGVAGGALNGGFVIKAAQDIPAGVYTGTLKVSFDAAACDPVFLSLLSEGDDADNWTTEDGKVVYTAQVQVTVDVIAPAAPEISIADGKREGTIAVTGTAPGAAFVILTYENDFTEENDEGVEETYTAKAIAAIFNPNPDGSFAIILA